MIAAVAWPPFAAALLALIAARGWSRALPAASLAAALPAPALALAALLWPPQRPDAAWWLQDRLALSLQLLLAVPLALVAGWRLLDRPPAGSTWPYWPACAQLLAAGGLLAVRAAWLFPMLAGLALAAAASVLLSRRHGDHGLLAAGLLLVAWLGIACLAVGSGHAAGWAGLQQGIVGIPPTLRLCGVLLLMLPMLLLAWTASAGLVGVRPSGVDALSARALLPVLAGGPALDVVLRLRALPGVSPGLLRLDVLLPVGGGLLGMLLACALMPAQRRQADRLMLAAALQLGAAAVGFGCGGTGGVVAGLMLLGGLALALPVALLPVPTRLGHRLQRLAVLALAGLPPFAPFAAGMVLLLRLSGDLPLLAAAVLAGFAVAALLLVAARSGIAPMDAVTTAARPVRLAAATVPGLLALALLGWLGLAMPPALAAWLLAASEGMAGTPWPNPGSYPEPPPTSGAPP